MSQGMRKRFSIIIPALHEASGINKLLEHLRRLDFHDQSECIVIDGGATGDTRQAIADKDVICLSSLPGRARQMNAGAAQARGKIFLFLHADTVPPRDILKQISRVMHDTSYAGGAFNLAIASDKPIYRLISLMASFRSRLTGIPYGDQAIFIRRDVFYELGGYPDLPILEDVAFMRECKKRRKLIAIIPQRVVTSSRRWDEEGALYTTLRNWSMLIAYYVGISPEKLAKYYRNGRNSDGA